MPDEKFLTDARNNIDAFASNVAKLKKQLLPTVSNIVESKPAAYYKSSKEVCPTCGKEKKQATGALEVVDMAVECVGLAIEIAASVLH